MFRTQLGAIGGRTPSPIFVRKPRSRSSCSSRTCSIPRGRRLPFGIAQIGKAFRNEINPRNFIFRSREFEQMELEYFCAPEQGMHLLDYWLEERLKFYENIGIPRDKLHVLTVPDADRAFYSKGTYDIEYEFPFGVQELEGVAYRTDYDLTQHQKASGKPLEYFDEETKAKFIPHVVEPSAGVDRTVLALLCEALRRRDGDRTKRANRKRASCCDSIRGSRRSKCGVFPLLEEQAGTGGESAGSAGAAASAHDGVLR